MTRRLLPLFLTGMLLSGCLAKTAVDVVTLPVKATGKVVDWTTTSQDEADRNYGRKMRKREAAEGKARRGHDKWCRKHPDQPCPPFKFDDD